MIKRMSTYLGMFGLVVVAAVLLAWVSSPDPKLNRASFEKTPVIESVAPLDEAITLAQFIGENGQTVTLQILGFAGETVTGINLTELGALPHDHPLLALSSISAVPLSTENVDSFPTIEVDMSSLLPSGTIGPQTHRHGN